MVRSTVATGDDLQPLLARLAERYPADAIDRQLADLRRHGDVIDDPALWLRTALEGDFKFTPLERVERCCCGSARHALLCRFVFWNLLGLRECRDCGTLFVSPRLTADAIRRVFNDYYFDPADVEFWGERRAPVFRDVLRSLERLGCRSVFDVGAAYGHFVAFAERAGLRAAGCDLAEPAVRWGRERLGVDLRSGAVGELPPSTERFDCVVSLDTLYYAPDPAATLDAMRALLRPGGYVFLRLRNGRGVAARARREGRQPVGRSVIPGEHVWAFTPRSAARLLARHGFELVGLEPAAYSRHPLGLFFRAGLAVNRWARQWTAAPVLTRSFDIVGRWHGA